MTDADREGRMSTVRTPSNRIAPDVRRAEILRSATDLFAERGFVSTTMDDIADRSGITKRTLYRYVNSKDELLFDIHDTFSGHAFLTETIGAASGFSDPKAALVDAIRRHVQLVAEHTTEIGVFLEERKHLSRERARLVDQRRGAWQSHVISLIEAGQKAKIFQDLPAVPVAQLMLGAMTEMYRWYRPDGPSTQKGLAEWNEALFLRGIATSRQAPTREQIEPFASARTELNGAGNKNRVRDAAIKEFAAHGYHATSIGALAAVADVTKGAAMYHTRYKNSLLAEIHTLTFESGISALNAARQTAPPDAGVAVMLGRMIAAHMQFLADHRMAIAVINENMRYLDQEAYRGVDSLRRRWIALFVDTISQGVREGEFTGEPSFTSRTLIGMFNSAARWYESSGIFSVPQFTDIFVRLIFTGLDCADKPAS